MAKRKKRRKKQKYYAPGGAWMSYRRIHRPEHPRADQAGFVGEHIIIMETKLGRYLEPDELTHHKDFHKANNKPSNLQNMTRKEHQQIPLMQARFLVENHLMGAFFDWWKNFKSMPQTPMQKAEMQLVLLENQRERMKVKTEKQNDTSHS